MSYRIEQNDSREHGSFGNYVYRVYEDELLIARYWHDYRGDEHGIEFLDGTSEDWPVGRMIDFIKGGGSNPIELSDLAVTYLKNRRELG